MCGRYIFSWSTSPSLPPLLFTIFKRVAMSGAAQDSHDAELVVHAHHDAHDFERYAEHLIRSTSTRSIRSRVSASDAKVAALNPHRLA